MVCLHNCIVSLICQIDHCNVPTAWGDLPLHKKWVANGCFVLFCMKYMYAMMDTLLIIAQSAHGRFYLILCSHVNASPLAIINTMAHDPFEATK